MLSVTSNGASHDRYYDLNQSLNDADCSSLEIVDRYAVSYEIDDDNTTGEVASVETMNWNGIMRQIEEKQKENLNNSQQIEEENLIQNTVTNHTPKEIKGQSEKPAISPRSQLEDTDTTLCVITESESKSYSHNNSNSTNNSSSVEFKQKKGRKQLPKIRKHRRMRKVDSPSIVSTDGTGSSICSQTIDSAIESNHKNGVNSFFDRSLYTGLCGRFLGEDNNSLLGSLDSESDSSSEVSAFGCHDFDLSEEIKAEIKDIRAAANKIVDFVRLKLRMEPTQRQPIDSRKSRRRRKSKRASRRK